MKDRVYIIKHQNEIEVLTRERIEEERRRLEDERAKRLFERIMKDIKKVKEDSG